MNAFDIFLLILISVLGLVGLLKGLVRLLIGVGALITAFIIAAQSHQKVTSTINGIVEMPDPIVSLISSYRSSLERCWLERSSLSYFADCSR